MALALGLVSCAGFRVPGSREPVSEVERFLSIYARQGQFNGTVLVAERGRVVYKGAFGKANFDLDVPNTPEGVFNVGSVTKLFTATLVMQLVQEGKLRLDGTLGEYLPAFAPTAAGRVTLRQLLTHTSGLSSRMNGRDELFWNIDARRSYSVDEFLSLHIPGTLDFEPGGQWRYSNAGYFVLGAIVERATGEDFAQALSRRILTPAGMLHSGLDREGLLLPGRVNGYVKRLGEYQPAVYVDASVYYSAAGFYSTVEDLLRWDRALSSDLLLNAETRRQAFTPQEKKSGYGWFLESWPVGKTGRTLPVALHSGGVPGFASLLVRSTSDEGFIILLDNTAQGNALNAIAHGLFDLLHGETPPAPLRNPADVVGPLVVNEGIEAAVREFRRLRRDGAGDVDLSESAVNAFAYQLLRMPRVEDALRFFQLNVESFPDSANVYDSLAEAYVLQGDKVRGLENYREALKREPDNDYVKARIDELDTPGGDAARK